MSFLTVPNYDPYNTPSAIYYFFHLLFFFLFVHDILSDFQNELLQPASSAFRIGTQCEITTGTGSDLSVMWIVLVMTVDRERRSNAECECLVELSKIVVTVCEQRCLLLCPLFAPSPHR